MTSPIIGLQAAADEAGVSVSTMLDWCRYRRIGEQVDGRWHIDPDKLQRVIDAREVLKPRDFAA